MVEAGGTGPAHSTLRTPHWFGGPVSERLLPRKLTFRAHGRTLVLDKRAGEKPEHRVMMALLWAAYLPRYPGLRIDVPIGGRYRPDLVQLDPDGRPEFWGECGAVGAEKLRALCSRYRATHLVFARWDRDPRAFAAQIEAALAGQPRRAPVELIGIDEADLAAIDEHGAIDIDPAALRLRRWG
jgi:hypothetical protein